MPGVLAGFAVIVVVVLLGYALGRSGFLGETAQDVLSRLVFFVATPALLFTTLAAADVAAVVSPAFVVAAVSCTVVAAAYAVVARWVWGRGAASTTVGALAASYVNSGNLGIPVAVYVLGSASYMAPVLLFQLVVMAPVALAVLDATSTAVRRSRRGAWTQPLRNPVTVASLAGLAVATSGVEPPEWAMRPVDLVAGAAVPTALIAYGMSLHGGPRPAAPGGRRDLVLAVALKNVVHPLAAYLVAGPVLGMEGVPLLAVTLVAALPTAQNVFVHASRYGQSVHLARDTVLVTTTLSLPVSLLVASALLP